MRLPSIIWYGALSSDSLLINAIIGEISELHSFNTLALRPSGPNALCMFTLINSFKTPFGSTVISPMGVNGLVPFEGISEFQENCG